MFCARRLLCKTLSTSAICSLQRMCGRGIEESKIYSGMCDQEPDTSEKNTEYDVPTIDGLFTANIKIDNSEDRFIPHQEHTYLRNRIEISGHVSDEFQYIENDDGRAISVRFKLLHDSDSGLQEFDVCVFNNKRLAAYVINNISAGSLIEVHGRTAVEKKGKLFILALHVILL